MIGNKWLCIHNELDDMYSKLARLNYAMIKGDVLSVQAYNRVNMRRYSDIDLLVPKCELPKFKYWLSQHEFVSQQKNRLEQITTISCSHQILPWKKELIPWQTVTIDLNFDIFWGEYEGKRIDIYEFLSDTIEVDIYGVKVKALHPIKSLIQLILHHYKDMNSIFLLATRKSIKYDMFKDIYHLLKNNLDDITLNELYKKSEEYEIIPYVFYILYYTGQIFEDKIVKRYTEAFRTPEGEALLECYGLCVKERKQWKFDFNARLESDNLYDLIKKDLTKKDEEKIAINKHIFLGEILNEKNNKD